LLAAPQLEEVDIWLRSILWDSKVPGPSDEQIQVEIHRLKARLVFETGEVKMVQGVRETFEIIDDVKSTSDTGATTQTGKLVLIGRGIHNVDFERSFLVSVGKKRL
jgi:hypothetical protein